MILIDKKKLFSKLSTTFAMCGLDGPSFDLVTSFNHETSFFFSSLSIEYLFYKRSFEAICESVSQYRLASTWHLQWRLILSEVQELEQEQHFNLSWKLGKKVYIEHIDCLYQWWFSESVRTQSSWNNVTKLLQDKKLYLQLPLLHFLFQSVNVCFWNRARVSDNPKQYQVQQVLHFLKSRLYSDEQWSVFWFIENWWEVNMWESLN